MKARPLPSQDYLLECFSYDSESGVLAWRQRPASHFAGNLHARNTFNAIRAGLEARSKHAKGYLAVAIDGRAYLVHRVIWKLVTGADPAGEIDHRNGDKACNQWSNLRDATHQQNAVNRGASVASKTGIKGVVEERGGFAAYIAKNGKTRLIGRHLTMEGAARAQRAAERALHGDFAHGATA